jgi:FOG: CheY-like receiver
MKPQFEQFDAKILLVEDYPINQELTKELLSLLGCEVEVADNGLQAIAMIETKLFDLILMDIQMPEMDGYQVTRAIRKKGGAFASIPIVALTANALQGDREKCLDAGMTDYLSKPIRGMDLELMLNKYLPTKKV